MWEDERIRSRKEQRRKQLHRRIAGSAFLMTAILLVLFVAFFHGRAQPSSLTFERAGQKTAADEWEKYDIGDPVKQAAQPKLDVQLLTINENSRPGIATDGVRSVVVHYTANPGSTAQNNRDYFESLKDTGENPRYIKTVWGVGYKIGEI